MKIGLQHRSRLESSGQAGVTALEEFQALFGAIAAWTNTQHDDDGHHTDVTATSLELTAVQKAAMHIISGWMDAGAGVAYSGAVTPPQITADVNDYSPVGIGESFLLRLAASVPAAIGGIKDGDRIVPLGGRLLALFNAGAVNITLTHEQIASSANFRFRLPGFKDMILPPNNFALLYYDAKSRRWAMLSSSSGTGGSNSSEFNAGNSGASLTVDWANGTQQIITLTHNVNLTLANGVEGQLYRLIMVEGGGGGFVPSFTSPTVVFENSALTTAAKAAGQVIQATLYYTLLNGGQYFAAYTPYEVNIGLTAGDLTLTPGDTTNDVTTTTHGFAPILPNDANKFFNGVGGYTVPIRTLRSSDGSVPVGNTVANTVTETAFTSSYTIPANDLAVGDVLRVTLRGTLGTDAVVAPTLKLKAYAGATTLLDTTAITLPVGAASWGWMLQFDVIVTTIGASGKFEVQGDVTLPLTATTATVAMVINTATITEDTTGTLALAVKVTWGTADPDDTITLRQWVVERLRG